MVVVVGVVGAVVGWECGGVVVGRFVGVGEASSRDGMVMVVLVGRVGLGVEAGIAFAVEERIRSLCMP